MTKLTHTQLIVLSAAAQRDDGAAVVPAKMNKAAASKVGSSLIARKLMREAKTKAGMPIWREDEAGRPISLIATKAGLRAIAAEDSAAMTEAPAVKKSAYAKRMASGDEGASRRVVSRPDAIQPPRAGSKQALVIDMLRAKSGATLDALVEATGWLPHTTRAALTGLRKRGISIERTREGDTSVYRIVGTASSAAD